MKKIVLIPILLLMAGCSGTLKQSWVDFRAHYNTFHNAEKSFNAGVNKVDEQPVEITPEESVIMVHMQPRQAGAEDFQQAIEKGARILNRFPESSLVDDALFIMGKSYYYRQEYHLAIQKFEELFPVTENDEMKQQAVIWKGKSLLHLSLYSQGISFLQEQLAVFDSWNLQLKAETGVLLAEHQAGLENWEEAATQLGNSLVDLEENPFKARTYFLYGQILERLQRYGEAYFAYNRVSSLYPDYQYVFWAELNKGKIARIEGNTDTAAEIFEAMMRDDKNYEHLDEISYQLAKTEQARGNYRQAERQYKQILHSSTRTPSQHVQAKSYYELGEIFSEVYDNYDVASAYYDSSSSRASQVVTDRNEEANIDEQASSYGRYASLRREEAEIDSLFYLGSLSKPRLDSVLQTVRAQRMAELNVEQENGNSRNVLVNVDEQAVDFSSESTTSTGFGFLSYRNSERVDQLRTAFQVRWGNRPLVDNWRRVEAIRNVVSQTDDVLENMTEPETGESGYSDADLGIHPEDVPRDEASRRKLRSRQANVWYELGNILFLNLDRPDSAAVYFKKILDAHPSDELAVRSKYALHELYNVIGNVAEAEKWRKQILENYPESIFAERIRERTETAEPADSTERTNKELLKKVSEIEQLPDSISSEQRAEQYRRLALENSTSSLAPHIHFRSIDEYVELAKGSVDTTRYAAYWRARDNDLNTGPNVDSTVTSPDTVSMPLSESRNPFDGAYWDSVRVLIEEYEHSFEEQPHRQKIEGIRSAIGDNISAGSRKPETCESLGIEPGVDPDMETFLQSVQLPAALQDQRLSGTIGFEVSIRKDGSVADYEMISESTLPELERAYEEAIEQSLAFYPIEEETEAETVRCRVTFPVRN